MMGILGLLLGLELRGLHGQGIVWSLELRASSTQDSRGGALIFASFGKRRISKALLSAILGQLIPWEVTVPYRLWGPTCHSNRADVGAPDLQRALWADRSRCEALTKDAFLRAYLPLLLLC